MSYAFRLFQLYKIIRIIKATLKRYCIYLLKISSKNFTIPLHQNRYKMHFMFYILKK